MDSQINIEGLAFAQIEESHMATMTDLGWKAIDLATLPISNEAELDEAIIVLRSHISDTQSQLETLLSAKDFPRGTLGLHGPAIGITEGFEAPAI